jgi:hypothetical protein
VDTYKATYDKTKISLRYEQSYWKKLLEGVVNAYVARHPDTLPSALTSTPITFTPTSRPIRPHDTQNNNKNGDTQHLVSLCRVTLLLLCWVSLCWVACFIVMLSVTMLSELLFYCYADCRVFYCYAECHYTESRVFIVMLGAVVFIFMLSVILRSPVMLNAVMLSVVFLMLCWMKLCWVLWRRDLTQDTTLPIVRF